MPPSIHQIGKFSDQPQNHKTSQANIDDHPTLGSKKPQQALRYKAMASLMSTLQQYKRLYVWDGATQTVGRKGGKLQNLPYLNIKAERLNGGTYMCRLIDEVQQQR